MNMSAAQLAEYEDQGFLTLPDCFSDQEVRVINRELDALRARELPGSVTERDGQTVRALHGVHMISEIMRRLSRHPRIVMPVRQMLGEDIYVHQFKINMKAAFKGDMWPWHQDYIYWQVEDGMRAPRAITVAQFLDDVNEFNGPMLFIPGSHRHGVMSAPTRDDASDWHAHVSADLKYTLTPETVSRVVKERGIVSTKGRRGSVVFFHCNVVHGSATNMSPFERRIAFVTFNSVSNALPPSRNPRPTFLVSRDFTPIKPLDDDALISCLPPAETVHA